MILRLAFAASPTKGIYIILALVGWEGSHLSKLAEFDCGSCSKRYMYSVLYEFEQGYAGQNYFCKNENAIECR